MSGDKANTDRHTVQPVFIGLDGCRAGWFLVGIDERLDILLNHYPRAEECFQQARAQYLVKEVATDDIVDAMVGAVTAMQYPRLATFPEKPLFDEEGIPMEIVYCSDF